MTAATFKWLSALLPKLPSSTVKAAQSSKNTSIISFCCNAASTLATSSSPHHHNIHQCQSNVNLHSISISSVCWYCADRNVFNKCMKTASVTFGLRDMSLKTVPCGWTNNGKCLATIRVLSRCRGTWSRLWSVDAHRSWKISAKFAVTSQLQFQNDRRVHETSLILEQGVCQLTDLWATFLTNSAISADSKMAAFSSSVNSRGWYCTTAFFGYFQSVCIAMSTSSGTAYTTATNRQLISRTV